VLAANRDEFHGRPTRQAGFWPNRPRLLAGRDEQAGGTWLGVSLDGRLAAVSNYREPDPPAAPESRGRLPLDFLDREVPAAEYAAHVDRRRERFGGFNLLLCDGRELHYLSNRAGAPRRLEPGIYGLSNHLLDTPWPKTCRVRDALAAALEGARPDRAGLFEALADTSGAPDSELPDTGVGVERERLLSPPFVAGDRYGTRSSSVVVIDADGGLDFEERSFAPGGAADSRRRYRCRVRWPGP